jgi:hypothetical protein
LAPGNAHVYRLILKVLPSTLLNRYNGATIGTRASCTPSPNSHLAMLCTPAARAVVAELAACSDLASSGCGLASSMASGPGAAVRRGSLFAISGGSVVAATGATMTSVTAVMLSEWGRGSGADGRVVLGLA